MKLLFAPLLIAIAIFCTAAAHAQTNSATEWIDRDTGHRVVQLSTEPGSESLYFNLNPFTPDGKRMVITTSNGISLVNLETRAVEQIIEGLQSDRVSDLRDDRQAGAWTGAGKCHVGGSNDRGVV